MSRKLKAIITSSKVDFTSRQNSMIIGLLRVLVGDIDKKEKEEIIEVVDNYLFEG